MLKLLQIDSCLGILSTGRITESIGELARANGWETYIAHGARYVGNSEMISYQVSSKVEEYVHYGKSLLFDMHGLGSVSGTKRLVQWIDGIKPDIIHLHCIHGYYLNYKILFEYLNKINIPIVWTFHDCWAFTGHCAYFDSIECIQWKSECSNCRLKRDYPKTILKERVNANFKLKKLLFTSCQNITIISVSFWLENLVKQSFWRNNKVKTIHNGLDLNVFKPYIVNKEHYGLENKFVILGVAAIWDKRKGLDDFIYLSKILDDSFSIVLVGLDDNQIKDLPYNIIGIKRTNSVQELAMLYSLADVFINPTYSDNFPTTNIEALACGTPVITYDTGGSPEAIDIKTGRVVPLGDVRALVEEIKKLKLNPLSSDACRLRAERLYDKNERFMDYIKLYEELLKNK